MLPTLSHPSFSVVTSVHDDKDALCDYVLAIPRGEKTIVWLTTHDKVKKCILFHAETLVVYESFEIHVYSDLFMGKGTIFSGTLFSIESARFLSIEDIYYYKGTQISNYTFTQKLQVIGTMLKENKFEKHIKSLFFGLPIHDTLLSKVREKVSEHKLYVIESLHLRTTGHIDSMKYIKLEHVVFTVKSEKTTDLYGLYCACDTLYGYAFIPNYKSSVMMRQYFKQENKDLDFLEESDSEGEESENPVLEHVKMVCYYNANFKKWEPRVRTVEYDVIDKSVLETII
jgi:hypothetical protein